MAKPLPARPAKRRSSKPLADLVQPALAGVLKARGFATADIIGHWPDIAGARLAEQCQPVQIQWPPRPKTASPDTPPQPATLVLRVEGAFALEAEMSAGLLIERINAVFGWRCVGKIRIKQGPVAQKETRPLPRIPVLPPRAAGKLAETLAGIEDEGLRQAFEKLGRNILGASVRKQ